MTYKKRLIYVVFVLTTIVAADHITKWAAIVFLKPENAVHIFWGDLFRLQYAENTGAFLSLGAGLPSGAREAVMIGLNALILLGLLVYFLRAEHIAWLPLTALTLIASGGIGNLIDRLFRDGRVVDFMNMGLSFGQYSLRTGIFNIADIAIMAGLFMIVGNELALLKRGQTEKSRLKEEGK